METKNAVIEETMLGTEDHGLMTAFIHLDYGGAGQSFGGYGFDEPIKDEDGKFLRRVGTAYGCEFIRRVLETLGVDRWEDLKGTHCRVKAEHRKVYAIGHIIKNKWFSPSDLAAEMRLDS